MPQCLVCHLARMPVTTGIGRVFCTACLAYASPHCPCRCLTRARCWAGPWSCTARPFPSPASMASTSGASLGRCSAFRSRTSTLPQRSRRCQETVSWPAITLIGWEGPGVLPLSCPWMHTYSFIFMCKL